MSEPAAAAAHLPTPPPPLHAYWFYTSSLPIDDPLSPLPINPTSSKQPPRPFSQFDSTALEAAYKELLQEYQTRDDSPQSSHSSSASLASPGRLTRTPTSDSRELAREGHPVFRHDDLSCEEIVEVRDEIAAEPTPIQRRSSQRSTSTLKTPLSPSSAPTSSSNAQRDNSVTGRPFARTISFTRPERSASYPPPSRSSGMSQEQQTSDVIDMQSEAVVEKEIPVGIQRLHFVHLPSFLLLPLYWYINSLPIGKRVGLGSS